MLLRERVLHRADDIAMRLKHDYPISSPEWNRWSNISASYNASTLGHAISTYFSEHSIGDVGDEDSQYVPRAGYVGTLAPGEKFEQEHALEDLPKKVLHPWPAMQQHAFHVRWPVTHPMTPPPLLWFALNNMYTEVRRSPARACAATLCDGSFLFHAQCKSLHGGGCVRDGCVYHSSSLALALSSRYHG